MNKKLAIVGIFYDGYYDIWKDFLDLIDKYCQPSIWKKGFKKMYWK